MRKACCDCAHLLSYSANTRGGTISCKRHSTQHVVNPLEHMKIYVCNEFLPRFTANSEPSIIAALRIAESSGSPALKKALATWFAGPPNDVTVSTGRGLPMLSVADGNLKTLEHDNELKNYHSSNHIFADVFGGVNLKWPLLFFLSENNKPGVFVETIGESALSIIYLGHPYSLAEITAAISHALSCQKIKLVRPWFLRHLRSEGIDANDPSFSSFVWLPPEVKLIIKDKQNIIKNSHTVIITEYRAIDEESVAELLEYNNDEYATLWCDARRSFHLHHKEPTVYEFSLPNELKHQLSQLGIQALFMSPNRHENLWAELPAGVFNSIRTTIAFVEPVNVNWVVGLDAFDKFVTLNIETKGYQPDEM